MLTPVPDLSDVPQRAIDAVELEIVHSDAGTDLDSLDPNRVTPRFAFDNHVFLSIRDILS